MQSSTDSVPLSVSYRMSLDDYRDMTQHLCSQQKVSLGAARWIWFLSIATASYSAVGYGGAGISFALGMCVACVLVFAYARIVRVRSLAAYAPREGGYILCSYELSLSDTGIDVRTPYWNGETLWRGVLAVDDGPKHIFLRLDTTGAYAVPKTAFGDQKQMADFLAYARSRQKELAGDASASSRASS